MRKVGTLETRVITPISLFLSKDYSAIPEDKIRTLTSLLTLVGGRIVFADAEYTGLDKPLANDAEKRRCGVDPSAALGFVHFFKWRI